ncbi:MAG: hypothetical protein QOI76_2165 [Frankiales bacterium]|nr:hypothetical protein [Frankiales bacterium]
MTGPVRRTVVAHPQTMASLRRRGRPATGRKGGTPPTETGQDELDVLLLRILVRAQLSLALRLAAVFGCLLGGLPLLLATSHWVRHAKVLGMSLPWFLLGVVIYPLMLAGGLLYVRLAERNEQDYSDLVEGTR